MASDSLSAALERLSAGGTLTAPECAAATAQVLDGDAREALVGAFLAALHLKGESPDELQGAVSAIRERMIPFDPGIRSGPCLDTCGTGGDGAETVNVSTATAIVVAACGVRVVKHGNRAASGRSGSSDVLERLGVAIDCKPDLLRRCLDDLGIAFLFAPRFHPGLKAVAAIRRQLPFRTIFNLVGPLCNPAAPAYQLVGVPREDHARRMAAVLAASGHIRRALVVTGSDGLDEVTLDGPTRVRIVESGRVSEESWRPDDFGLRRVTAGELKVADAGESCAKLRRLFAGDDGPVREIVVANAAAALWTVEPVPLRDAVNRAARAIDSGAAARLVERWAPLSRGEA
jgi:anthranilate phosphoribosyltransferase